MEQTTKTEVYFHCLVDNAEKFNIRKALERGRESDLGLKVQVAKVRDAYFGRHPTPGPFSVRSPLGLNCWIDYPDYGSAGATYTAMEEIEGFLDSMGISKPEEMIGKSVVAYERDQRLVGLSALPKKKGGRDDKFIDGVCASDT